MAAGLSLWSVLIALVVCSAGASSEGRSGLDAWREWWRKANAVLFQEVRLTAEQQIAIDAVVELQMQRRLEVRALREEFGTAKRLGDRSRVGELGRELEQRQADLHPFDAMERMRALLSTEQKRRFDMNRAELYAGQRSATGPSPPNGEASE